MAVTALIMDFGGSSVKYALADETGALKDSGKLPAPSDSIEQFKETVGELCRRFEGQFEGISVSMPGYIDPETGFLPGAGAYSPLFGKNIADLIREVCPVPVFIENDGKCAALAEAWKGALSDCRDGAVLVLGSAIGGGIIKDGRIHSGKHFAAGELSYIITDPTRKDELGLAYMGAAMHGLTYRVCKAKNIDLSVQNAAAILMDVDAHVKMPYADPDAPLKNILADGVQIFRWLDEGDPDAEAAYRCFIRALAVVIHSVQIVYAPEKIALGGGLSLQSRIFGDVREELAAYYKGMLLGNEIHAEIVKSRYLNECNLIGAMYNYLIRTGRMPERGA